MRHLRRLIVAKRFGMLLSSTNARPKRFFLAWKRYSVWWGCVRNRIRIGLDGARVGGLFGLRLLDEGF